MKKMNNIIKVKRERKRRGKRMNYYAKIKTKYTIQ